jgi:multisubunit Na+/H+ antiporter MnhB subunit
VNLESFLWYLSVIVIVLVSLYTFYAFFRGEITPFGAFTVLLITYAAFGFMLGVASHLAAQRKSGWVPEEEGRRWSEEARPSPNRRGAAIPGHPERSNKYSTYRKLVLLFLVVGILIMGFQSPPLGLMVMCTAAISYVILRAIELFDEPEI